MNKITVVYEDRDILVCFKPAGIPTQTAALTAQDMVSMVKSYLAAATGEKNPYLALVHRLDQPVSGLLVFGKHKKSALVELREKQYHALCIGSIVEKEGVLRHYLWKNPKTSMAEICNGREMGNKGEGQAAFLQHKEKRNKEQKEAVLFYKVEREDEDCSLVRVRLETGRFHQIRAQFSAIGHPLLGDQKYGSILSKELSIKKGIRTVALCADRLKIMHPTNKREMEFRLPGELLPDWNKGRIVR